MEIKSTNRSQASKGRMAAAQLTLFGTASRTNKSTRGAPAADASLLSMKCKARSALFDFPDAEMNWHLAKRFAWSDGVLGGGEYGRGINTKHQVVFLNRVTFLTTTTQTPLWVTVSLARRMHSSLPHSPFALSLLSSWCRQQTINHPASAGIWMPQPSDWCRKWMEHLVAHRHLGSASFRLAAFGKQNAMVAWWGGAEVIAGSQLIHAKWS